jgi:short-subunit dehydrogenase
MKKQSALITGATGGIGYELAKVFAAHGHDVVLVARNADKLKEISDAFQHTYNIAVHIVPLNLLAPDAPNELYHYLKRNNITVEYLVNNAGFGTHGYFHEIDLAENLDLVQLNIAVVTHLARLFLADMVKRNAGGILNIASTAAFQPGPFMATYYASKAYVLSLTEAIAHELQRTKVKISVLCPGPTDTDFQQRAGITKTILGSKGMLMMPPDKVAMIGYQQFMRRKRIIIPGILNKAGAFAAARAPRSVVLPIVKRMQKN